jgi:hypothetical protein
VEFVASLLGRAEWQPSLNALLTTTREGGFCWQRSALSALSELGVVTAVRSCKNASWEAGKQRRIHHTLVKVQNCAEPLAARYRVTAAPTSS